MANGNSRALEELMEIGTRVSFKMRSSGDLYHGSIFYYTPQPNGFLFGIEHVSVWRADGKFERLSGFNHFNVNDVMELDYARQRPNNTQDGQNNNRDEAASSSSTPIKNKMGSLRLDPPPQ
uniref:Uncharacterized protein n=1 Tax=Noccaea caerulescens TaxID=107243 RepID=A0A1J3GA57_NOCCA